MKLSAAESKLLSTRERDMLRSKGPWNVKDLVSLIKRIRDLRDKQRQLTQRQKISSARRTGSKAGTSGVANARTAEKGRLLDRALSHYEGELDKLNTESSAAAASLKVGGAKKSATRKPAKKAAKGTAAKTASKATKSAKKSTAKSSTANKAAGRKTATKTSVAKNAASKKPIANKATAKKKPASKSPAKKASVGKASKVAASGSKSKTTSATSTAKKSAAKKAPAKKVQAGKPPARKVAAGKAQTSAAKPARRAVSKKVTARKVAKAAEVNRNAPPKGPVQNVSDKARMNLPQGPGGHVDSQITSLPSHNKRAKRAR